ncbi:low-molecular-weight cysteine-rich 69 [Perilla frutescens var. hirtella]|uniref:Low-molecular-weight cysteine-rich 69 n=1 Tax=Perilla frutescens var. hirtella TaxID=608512 RepID=A0AAD4P8Q5_PERFH|nr:low-molecular-weight cysteine-rich 69 [Perilla frutescens var. hirtella]
MGSFLRLFATVFLMLMLVFSTGLVAEARTCETKSHRFKGICVRKANCAAVCQTEGFHGGHCRGFRRRCYCTKHC